MCSKHEGYLANIQSEGELEELNRVMNIEQKKHLFPYWIGEHVPTFQAWCSLQQAESVYNNCEFLKVSSF